jgi:hypothetical protein
MRETPENAELKKLHTEHKEAVIEGRASHSDLLYATMILPTNPYFEMSRPPHIDGYQLLFHSKFENYNDPFPVLKEIEYTIAKLHQLSTSFRQAWIQHMKAHSGQATPKVTLEEEVEQLEDDSKKMRKQQSRFAEIAVPMFEELYRKQMMASGCLLRAFGVTHQDIAELEAAAVDDGVRYERGMFNNFMYKGIAIVQDDRAKYRDPVPIFKYGHRPLKPLTDELGIKLDDFEITPLTDKDWSMAIHEEEKEPVEQLVCGKGDHAKNCRCHLGYRIRKD